MNGKDAFKLMLDGSIVISILGTKYKIENNKLMHCIKEEWEDNAINLTGFLNSSNFKEYKEPIEIKRKLLVIEDRVGSIKMDHEEDFLECNDVSSCDELLCIDCPLSNDRTIPSTDKRIVEINISKEMEKIIWLTNNKRKLDLMVRYGKKDVIRNLKNIEKMEMHI